METLLNNPTFIIIAILLVATYLMYAGIIKKKNKAKEALSGIDVQLKKRSNLIPNILQIAKKYMEHEKGLLEEITRLRAKVDEGYKSDDSSSIKDYIKQVGALDANMGKLMIAVENYPDLKSDQTMLQAMRTYNEVEEQISAARRFYNSAVNNLNNAIEIFPGNLIAPLANAKTMPFYEADEAARAPVNASDYLK